MALPDFVIVGAMKCGTSTLAAQLGAQPGIFMSEPKEPNFFSDDPIYARGLGWYESLFDAAGPGDLKGEASTHYTKLPTYPSCLPRMAEALGAPRIVYILRNPVERAVSHYIHAWSEGQAGDNVARAFADHPEFTDYGRYAMQIAPYVETFGAGTICLSSLERLKKEPQVELVRIAAFLGHEGPVRWIDDLGQENVSTERARPLPMQRLLVDNPVATFLRRTLVPKGLRTRIREARMMKTRPVLDASTRTRLETIFAEDRDMLAGLFPAHPALADCYPFITS